MHWFFVIHEIIFSAPAQSRRRLPQRRRNSWPAGRTSAGSWTKHRGGSCCTPAGRPSPPNPCPPRWQGVGDKEGQRRQELHLPKGESGIQPHEPQPHPRQAEEQEQLTRCTPRMAAQRGLSASRWRLSVLRVSSCLSQLSPALGPAARVGQKMQQPRGPDAAPPAARRGR